MPLRSIARNIVAKSICNIDLATARCRGSLPLYIVHFWTSNWGDAINRPLVRLVSGRRVVSIDPHAMPHLGRLSPNYLVIGSTVHFSNSSSIIWGAGLLSNSRILKYKPQKVAAVRGPRTRAALMSQGIDVPAIYGDPAILLPYLYRLKKGGDNDGPVGLIPHYVDSDNERIQNFKNVSGVRLVKIKSKNEVFLKSIQSCSAVVSTSLHGLIAAESLGIPACWASVSNKVLGNGFKFYDYYEGTGRHVDGPWNLSGSESAHQLADLALRSKPAVFDIPRLLAACPFNISADAKEALGTDL